MKLQEIPEISLLNPGYLLQSFHLPDTRLAADLERLTEKASTMVWAIARYVLIAVAALVVGAVINAVVRNGVTWADFF